MSNHNLTVISCSRMSRHRHCRGRSPPWLMGVVCLQLALTLLNMPCIISKEISNTNHSNGSNAVEHIQTTAINHTLGGESSHQHHHPHSHHHHHHRVPHNGNETTVGVAPPASSTALPMPSTLPSGLLNPVPPIDHIDPYLLPPHPPTPSHPSIFSAGSSSHRKTSKEETGSGVGHDESTLLLPLPNEADHVGRDQAKKIKFEEEPSDSYIVRGKSAILRCITLNALNAWFTCNSGDERRVQSNQKLSNYVDPQTGVRLIEIDLEVTRSDVEEHHNSGYTNPFQCWCTAYGGQHQIMSRKASVSFAYLKRHFFEEPQPVEVSLGEKVRLTCLPPDGRPRPVVFWMKNDAIILESHPLTLKDKQDIQHKEIEVKNKSIKKKKNKVSETDNTRVTRQTEEKGKDKDGQGDEDYEDDEDEEDEEEEGAKKQETTKQDKDYKEEELLPDHLDDLPMVHANYVMANDFSLTIKKVSHEDQANYTCGVRNVANIYFSRPAMLTMKVNGEWSEWGSWSSCAVPGGAKCGKGMQKRTRHCSNSTPVSNGQVCVGESLQVMECDVPCVPVHGFWSPWSSWSPCSIECNQIRHRQCNSPAPENGGNDCFGPELMVRNCTGGSCRMKNGFATNIDAETFPQPASAVHSHDAIYWMIIVILVFIILFIVMLVLYFNRHRRQGKSALPVWNDLELDGNAVALADEDGQTMLMLLQQSGANRLPVSLPPPHQRAGSVTARHLTPLAGNLQRQQFIQSNKHLRTGPVGTTAEKLQLISRLNNSHQNIVDHFVMRCDPNGSGSGVSTFSSNNNKYEEPIFSNASPFRADVQHKPPLVPPLPPTNISTPPVCSSSPHNSTGTGSSNTTVTISTNTTTGSGESSLLDEHAHLVAEEPDYAEPIIDNVEHSQTYSNYHSGVARQTAQRVSRSRANHMDKKNTRMVGANDETKHELCGLHEKFIKLSMDIFKHGHFSLLPNLGVGIYLTPNMFNAYYIETVDLYLRYGVDTSTKHSTGAYCSLSPVVTVNFSKNVGDLSRPFVLCFRHCISLPSTTKTAIHRLDKNVLVLWQDTHTNTTDYDQNRNRLREHLLANAASSSKSLDSAKEARDNRWVEIMRYGEDSDKGVCYLECDDQYVYLVTSLPGKYVLCLSPPNHTHRPTHTFASPLLAPRIESDLVKLVNFSLVIEQFSATEHLLKVFIYDSLPNSTVNLFNQLPSSGQFHLRLGDRCATALKLTSRGGSIFLELQAHKDSPLQRHQIKGMKRIEIPLGHVWNAGPNVLLHCSFIVQSSITIQEIVERSESRPDSDDEEGETGRMIHSDQEDNGERLSSSASASHYDHLLDYEIKIWQSSKTCNESSIKSSTPMTNVVHLKRETTSNFRRGRHPATSIGRFYREECVRLFDDRDLALRNRLITSLDTTRCDQLDWRELARRCGLGHYLPYLAGQSSPSTQILELWESRVMAEFVQANDRSGGGKADLLDHYEQHSINEAYGAITTCSSSPLALREHYYTLLLHMLQSFARDDLVQLIVDSHQD